MESIKIMGNYGAFTYGKLTNSRYPHTEDQFLTLSITTNFMLFQDERVCRRQFHVR